MKRIRGISILVLTVSLILMNTIPALAAGTVYSQIEFSAVPYKTSPNTYLITQAVILTWKKYNTILGYNDMGTQKTTDPITEVYENRQGDTPEGSLNFSWTFDGTVLQPITENKKGPINLGITLTQTADGVNVDFATTRVFDGKVTITLNVGSYYQDGDKLNLSYVNGVNTSQIHGTDTKDTAVNPTEEDGLTVQQSLVTFTITNGGTYFFTKVKEENKDKEANIDNIVKDGDTNTKKITASEDIKAIDKDIRKEKAAAREVLKTRDKAVTGAPKTGSKANTLLYGVVILLAGGGIILCRRKNRLQK